MNNAGSDVRGLLDSESLSRPIYQDVYQAESLARAFKSWPVLAALDAASEASVAGNDGFSHVGPDCPVLAVMGPKGGVGRTTCAAALGAALAGSGMQVVLVDLDAQNGLEAHFAFAAETGGFADPGSAGQHGLDWSAALGPVSLQGVDAGTGGRLQLLPYRRLSDGDGEALAARACAQPDWLATGLASLRLGPGTLVILDLPAQPCCITRQALAAAHFTLAVMQADAASLLLADRTRAMIDEACATAKGFARPLYLINRLNHGHRLDHDISRLLRQRYSGQVIGLIHNDQAVGEALAHGRTVLESAPNAQASVDFQRCAQEFRTVMRAHSLATSVEGVSA